MSGRSLPQLVDGAAYAFAGLFALDRLLKLAAVVHFFRQPPPPAPERWPSVALVQPITRGATNLRANLEARANLDYPAPMRHILICDAHDSASQATCRAALAAHPDLDATLVLAAGRTGAVAAKVEKMQAGLPRATADVLAFVDDDISLRPDALRVLVRHLSQPGVGAAFGLACYISWGDPWSSLMSAFVNANALLSYIPLTYLTDPFSITGHVFALRAETFRAAGGFDGLERRIDDDHALAFRVRRMGLRLAQTAAIYDVANHLGAARAYLAQMKRWFIFPRQALLPSLAPRERALSLLGGAGNLLPGLLVLLALWTRRRSAQRSLAASLGLFAAVYAFCEVRYLRRATPPRRWPLLAPVALVTPLHIAAILLGDAKIAWRGQRLRILRGGGFEIIGAPR